MIDYFTDNGWPVRTRVFGAGRDARATTDDGWFIYDHIRDNGNYSITVYSGLYWTNDEEALSVAIDERSTYDFSERSHPGEYPRFPRWDDPIVNRTER